MKKYKLIKKYPASPVLGIVIHKGGNKIYSHIGDYYHSSGQNVHLLNSTIENSPEFWEEVVEKEYEILSFIDVTTDNSSYTEIAQEVANGVTGTSQREASSVVSTLIDVTNTTNVKVKFSITAATTGVNVLGGSTKNFTNMMFKRLGDT